MAAPVVTAKHLTIVSVVLMILGIWELALISFRLGTYAPQYRYAIEYFSLLFSLVIVGLGTTLFLGVRRIHVTQGSVNWQRLLVWLVVMAVILLQQIVAMGLFLSASAKFTAFVRSVGVLTSARNPWFAASIIQSVIVFLLVGCFAVVFWYWEFTPISTDAVAISTANGSSVVPKVQANVASPPHNNEKSADH